MSEPLVIVGNGMAAARLVDELAKVALGRYAIAVIGDEPRLAYNRVLLSSVLAGETASHDIELKPAAWWRDRGVTLKYGCVATEIDVGRRELKIANEESIAFSRLVLATGSTPLRLNVPGADLAGVHTFRDSRDVDLLLTLAAQKKRVVVVGGGLLGLEAAYGLAKAGAPVTLIHLMDRLMERQLDAPAAELLKSLVERKGIKILLNANTARIHGETPRRRRRTDRRTPDRRRRGDFRGRHPAECRAGEGGRHSRQSRHRRRRSSADRRAGYLRARRMRRASRHLLRPGRAGLRAGAGAGAASRGQGAAYQRQRGRDQSEGLRRQRVFRRRFHRRGRQREPSCSAMSGTAPTRSW